MALPVPSISCFVLNHHNLFYQTHNALAFNRDMCCHLALCLWLLPFHWSNKMFYVVFEKKDYYNWNLWSVRVEWMCRRQTFRQTDEEREILRERERDYHCVWERMIVSRKKRMCTIRASENAFKRKRKCSERVRKFDSEEGKDTK